MLDLDECRASLSDYYNNRRRPAVDPELLIRMVIVGCIYGITSERRLCE